MRLVPRIDVSGLIQVCLMLLCGISCAQQTTPVGEMDRAKPAILSTELTIQGLDGKTVNLRTADLAALPHKTVSVYNEHTKACGPCRATEEGEYTQRRSCQGQALHDGGGGGRHRSLQRVVLARRGGSIDSHGRCNRGRLDRRACPRPGWSVQACVDGRKAPCPLGSQPDADRGCRGSAVNIVPNALSMLRKGARVECGISGPQMTKRSVCNL